MVGEKRSSWPSSSVVISVIVVLLCLGEFIRVELILKQHVTRIQDLESNCVQNNRPQHDGGTTKKTPSDNTVKPDRPKVRVRRNALTQRDLDKLHCTVTIMDKKCRTGLPGLPGPPGLKGDRGYKGKSGPPGRKGKRGRKGNTGMPGWEGTKGIMGPPGIKGERGHKGPLGMPGIKGDPGMPGMKGDPGIPGMKGDPGMPGMKGEPGLPVMKGEPGMPGIKGDSGMPGIKGDPGMPGIKGEPGLSASYPVVIVSPPSLVVKEGDKAVFHCSSSGYPKPVIRWKKLGESSQLTSDDQLVISNVTLGDSGVYQCEARNLLGTARRTVRLTLLYHPRVSLAASGPLYFQKGDNVTLPLCHATGSPAPTVTWSRVSGHIDQSKAISKGGLLSLFNLGRRDSDTYLCSAKNQFGSGEKRIKLIFMTPPEFISKPPKIVVRTSGRTISLTCRAKGVPIPSISWRKLNGNVTDASRTVMFGDTLYIRGAVVGDSGLYICSATSVGASTIETATRIVVRTGFVDCAEWYKYGERRNGVYTVDPDGRGPFRVYCDMKTDGGGWTVFQRRQDGSVDFYRGWNQYKKGFGTLTGEFWLGNDKIHRLTSRTTMMLRVELEDWDGMEKYAKYSTFSIGSESSNYRLSVSSHSGSATDSLIKTHNGRSFTTKDRDNDKEPSTNCASYFKGAWWYEACYDSNLNGKYYRDRVEKTGVVWYSFKRNKESLKFTEMKIKPK